MKARRKEGELSFPFDLSRTPIESVEKLLNNDFLDFFTDLKYLPDLNIWNNTKYNIAFPHDKDMDTLDDFISRYSERIKNFRKICQTQDDLVCITTVFNQSINIELFNKIYNHLKKYIKNSFTYYVFNFIESSKFIINETDCLNKQILYNEISVPDGYLLKWHQKDYIITKESQEILEKIENILIKNEKSNNKNAYSSGLNSSKPFTQKLDRVSQV